MQVRGGWEGGQRSRTCAAHVRRGEGGIWGVVEVFEGSKFFLLVDLQGIRGGRHGLGKWGDLKGRRRGREPPKKDVDLMITS